MAIDRAEKPLLQLRKLLDTLPRNPAPDAVHELRTRARKIEAMAMALATADAGKTKKLLKSIKPLRKAAGSVRDMDVLTGDLMHMPQNGNQDATHDSLLRLVEHLGTVRRKSADGLVDTVNRQRRPARRSLKKYAKFLESVANGKKPPIGVGHTLEPADGGDSRASTLMAELREWPRLNNLNIHHFRLKVKELRYVLQLFPGADPGLVDSLAKVKDDIGEWHDWQQLLAIAREVLDARKDKTLLAEIDASAKQKLAHALAAANTLRRRHLKSVPAPHKAA